MDSYFFPRLDGFIKKNQYTKSAAMQYFLNPAEQYETEIYLKTKHGGTDYILYGGYDCAERRLFVLNPPEKIQIKSVKIIGSGYHKLTHKDFMGAILGLGIERRCIGDIIAENNTAVIFTTDKIHEFLLGADKPLEYIGKDKVKAEDYAPDEDFSRQPEYAGINGVIASARLDSVISALIKTSREKAKILISAGNVQHNYTQEFNNDKIIMTGDVISVRGYGRFKISGIEDRTKKNKLRLTAIKNI